MTTKSTPHSAFDAAPDDEARTTRQLAVLRELVDQGMDLARRLHTEAMAASTPITAGIVERHALVARGIRHALALEAFLVRTRAKAGEILAARQRTYLHHRVDGAITKAGGQTFPMRTRLEEYVANPGLDAEFARRPFEQIVAGICRDLGIPPPAPPPIPAAPAEPSHASTTPPAPPQSRARTVERSTGPPCLVDA